MLIALRELSTLDSASASGFGYAGGAIVNYYLAHKVVFRSSASHATALPTFMVVASIGLAINTVIMYVLANRMGIHYLLAQLIATGVVLVWNFVVNRLWTFRH